MIRGYASFTQKVTGAQQTDGGFLALFGEHAEPHPSFLYVKHSIGTVSLQEDTLLRPIVTHNPAEAGIRQESFGVKRVAWFFGTAWSRRRPAKRGHTLLREAQYLDLFYREGQGTGDDR
jgi:hypothetical protein